VDKALGHILRLRDNVPIQIVGVVKDSSNGSITDPPPPMFYLPNLQQGSSRATVQLRTKGDPTALVSLVREQISALAPGVTPLSAITMARAFSTNGLFTFRVFAILSGAFGVIALSLAVVGLYGVVSFVVGRRTQEIGIRIALGAKPGDILRMILANGISLATAGVLVGIVVALAAAPLLRSLLHDISPRDPLTFVVIAVLLLTTTSIASWIPAHRAAHVDPNAALRCE
jgi:putative ABC transport system permease protein